MSSMKHSKHKAPDTALTQPEKMKPHLHLDIEEIEGLGEVEIADRLVLEVKVKVTGIMQHENEKGDAYTDLDFEITSAKLSDREVRREKSGEESEGFLKD